MGNGVINYNSISMIAVLQPFVPHYREAFFSGIMRKYKTSLFCYEKKNVAKKENFKASDLEIDSVSALQKAGFLLYNPLPFLRKENRILILMLNFGHLTTWLLLLLKPFHKRKIILFGHGISVKRYVKEQKKPHFLLKWMIYLSDGIWFYTKSELSIWSDIFPKKKMIALGNTISGLTDIIHAPELDKEKFKQEYNIRQNRVLIFCARFNEPARRVDLLIKAIKDLNSDNFGFIIIGDGRLKPDFTSFSNVYDFGAVYDVALKHKLFSMADIYYQPGWVGLSIVEAMAYGKPVFTFQRTETMLQCVEYDYLQNGVNSRIYNSYQEFAAEVSELSDMDLFKMSENARNFVAHELLMENMISNALRLIDNLTNSETKEV